MTPARQSEVGVESCRLSEGDRNGHKCFTQTADTQERKAYVTVAQSASMNEHKVSYDHCTPGAKEELFLVTYVYDVM